jgi:hypothetical protein
MNLQVDGRTVAMDHAMMVHGELRFSLVGVPGQRRFLPVRDALARGAAGAIWVHRAGEAVDLETAEMVTELESSGAEHIVFVNHHNGHGVQDGWSPPMGCAQPRAVISGNLLEPRNCLASLRDELVKLVRSPRKEPIDANPL